MIKNLFQLSNIIRYNNNIRQLTDIVKLYNGNDWKKYIKYSDKIYHKNMKYSKIYLPFKLEYNNIYLLEWQPNAVTKIHSHTNNGCIFKVLDGNINEKLYKNNWKYKIPIISTLYKNDVRYIDDELGLHSVENPNNSNCYSLHIYKK